MRMQLAVAKHVHIMPYNTIIAVMKSCESDHFYNMQVL